MTRDLLATSVSTPAFVAWLSQTDKLCVICVALLGLLAGLDTLNCAGPIKPFAGTPTPRYVFVRWLILFFLMVK